MEVYSDWTTALSNSFSGLMERLAGSLPNLIGAILLLIIGWLVAKALRGLAIRFSHLIDKLLLRYTRKRGMKPEKAPTTSPQVLGGIVFWVVILFFITAATHVLDLQIFTTWLNRVIAYLPTLLAGGLIILAGILVSTITRDLVIAAVPHLPEQQRALLGRSAYFVILITAIVIGADQIGIDITFLVIILTVLSATLLGGIAISVSLGARQMVANIISAHYLKQTYRVGQNVRMADYQGKVLELNNTSVVLETEQGLVTLPASLVSEQPSILLAEYETNE
jgi:hypothetical protein